MATPSALPANSTIQVNHRTDRSFSTSLLTSSIKPFGASLVKPPSKPIPAGSPHLEPHDSIYQRCNVRQRLVAGLRVYDVNARSAMTIKYLADATGFGNGELEARKAAQQVPARDSLSLDPTPSHTGHDIRSHDFARTHSGRRKMRHVYYFAGGGWRAPAGKEHWKLASALAVGGTSDRGDGETTVVSIVSYPLAPHCPAAVALPMLERLYYAVLRPVDPSSPAANGHTAGSEEDDEFTEHIAPTLPQNEEIWLAGDSAGGNIALALTLDILRRDPRAPTPAGLLLISPAVDLRLSHSEIPSVAKKDPVLTVALSTENARAWCGADIRTEDPRVSPLLSTDLGVLARRGVVVCGVVGMYDIHAPGCVELVRKLAEAGVRGKWLEWDKQMHCFPLAFSYGLNEGKEALRWMVDVLGAPR